MHEYSIVQALLAQVEREASAHRAVAVRRLEVSIGELSGGEADLLATAYDTFRERSVCEGAELAIRRVAARWACPSCTRDIARGELLRCPSCGVPAQLAGGDEIVLERIEMEVA